MKNDFGVYAKNTGGVLQRRLLTVSGEVPLPDSTPGAEIIDFSELNFHYYAVIIDQLITCQPYLVKTEKGEHFGEIDNNVYGFIVDMANDLMSTMEKVSPLFGTLTRTALADNLPQDDGTAMHCLRTAQEIIHTLTDVIACQFEMNDVLDALCMKGDPSIDAVGEFLRDVRLAEVSGLSNPLSGYYCFRSMEDYYHFLLLRMVEDKTRVARCECCGRFFIPRTRAATKYCDRVIRDGKTCKQVAPALKHKEQAERSKVIGAFDRAKRRMYKRYERALDVSKKPSPKDISYAEYYDWLEPATKARDDYLSGELTLEQALAVIEAELVKDDDAQ